LDDLVRRLLVSASAMTLTDYFDRTDVITIETTARDGRKFATPIWGVVVDGTCYIRSGYGEDSAWYRRLRRTWRAGFGDRGQYPARLKLVTDEDTRKRVDEAYLAKYRQDAPVRLVVLPEVRAYTFRLVPVG
jgi:hypothetical protein